jgi:hypothetical protein
MMAMDSGLSPLGCPGMTARVSPVPAIDRRHRQFGEFDAVKARTMPQWQPPV